MNVYLLPTHLVINQNIQYTYMQTLLQRPCVNAKTKPRNYSTKSGSHSSLGPYAWSLTAFPTFLPNCAMWRSFSVVPQSPHKVAGNPTLVSYTNLTIQYCIAVYPNVQVVNIFWTSQGPHNRPLGHTTMVTLHRFPSVYAKSYFLTFKQSDQIDTIPSSTTRLTLPDQPPMGVQCWRSYESHKTFVIAINCLYYTSLIHKDSKVPLLYCI